MAEMTVATVLTTLTSIVTSVISIFASVLSFVSDNPLILTAVLMPVAIVLVPKGISIFKRALGKKRI